MATNDADLRDEIIASLRSFSERTEAVFIAMAEVYPSLIADMRLSLSATDQLLKGQEGQRSGDTESLSQIIDEVKLFVEQAYLVFQQDNVHDKEMHAELADQIQSVSGLRDFIDRIREDSGAMELISLNAMTVALKAGNQGRAFSYITEELKRLSTRTIELTDIVTNRGLELVRRFEQFQKHLQELGLAEENLFNSFRTRIDASFSDFSEGISQIISTIFDIRSRAEQVLKPLTTIMSEVQKHDLIRQSIDHVIISVGQIGQGRSMQSVEDRLDEMSFFELLPDLCTNVLRDVANGLAASKTIFERELDVARKTIETLETERVSFVARAFNEHIADSPAFRFSHSFELFEVLYRDIANLYREKELAVRSSKDVQRQVRELDDSFKDFDSLIMRFRTIDVASRIEIAKQEVLAQMRGTVNEMTDLTKRIEVDVETSAGLTSDFLEHAKKLLETYRSAVVRQNKSTNAFIDELRRKNNRLRTAKDTLTASIGDQRMFTGTFLASFGRTKDDLDSLNELMLLIKDLQSRLSLTKSKISEQKQAFMREHGISEWKLETSKLKTMVDKFTISAHKKIAGELGGFTVEEGVQSGDITFF